MKSEEEESSFNPGDDAAIEEHNANIKLSSSSVIKNVFLQEELEEPSPSLAQDNLRCMICFYVMDPITTTTLENTVQYIFKTFNMKKSVPEIKEEFQPQLCPTCAELVLKAKSLIDQLDEIQNSLFHVKDQMKSKLLDSFEIADFTWGHPDDFETWSGPMADIIQIRQDFKKLVMKPGSASKRKTQSQKTTVKTEILDPSMNPYVLVERSDIRKSVTIQTKRTSSGRIIKPPRKTDVYEVFDSGLMNNLDEIDVEDKNEMIVVDDDDELDEGYVPPQSAKNHKKRDDDWMVEDLDDMSCSSFCSETDDYEDNLRAEAETETNENINIPKKRRKRQKKNTKSIKSVAASSRNKKTTRIPIKVSCKSGTEYDGVYLKIEEEIGVDNNEGDQDKTEKTITKVNSHPEIYPGAVVSLEDDIIGIRINCTDAGCTRSFSSIEQMKLHKKKDHEGIAEPFECNCCDKSFSGLRQLKMHIKQDHDRKYPDWMRGKRKHNCAFQDCKQIFRNGNDLQIHIRTIHTHETPFKCSNCEESFVSALKRECHIEQQHHEVPPLKCEHCPRAFYRQHRLREHVKSHTGERSYLCEICSKSFSQPAYLRYHQTQHKELALDPYRCEDCDKTFATPVNLRIHQQTQHLKDYRYHCEICNHGATHKSHLRLHMRTHSGERPHICDHCSKSFTRASQLKIHVRSHTGERPYLCKQCPKTFTNSSKLRRHELIHAQNKPFKCSICDKGFSQLSNLQSHVKCTHTNKKNNSSSTTMDKNINRNIIEVEEEEVECVFEPIEHHQIFGIPQQSLSSVPFLQVVNASAEGLDSESTTYQEFILIPSLDTNFTTK